MNVKLFIACHKACDVPQDEMYLPLHVGAFEKEDIGFERDDRGENISSKNPLYCELTGLYWCVHNLEYDYLGLVHYRRYFTLKSKSYQKEHGALSSVLTKEEIEPLLETYKVIVPKKRNYYIETVYSHYAHTFDGKQLDEARNIIEEMCSDYLESFDSFMAQKKAYIFNMFVMPRNLVKEYCDWLFPILFELEKRIDTESMSAFEKRYVGRVGERLFNVWLLQQIKRGNLKQEEIKEIPYLYLGKIRWDKKVIGFIMAKLFGKKYKESF